ncbi:MAG: hypothetical protein V5A74_04565 [Desulfohalobiaceae bacterium]
MRYASQNSGFTLVQTIFIIVVLGLLGAFMVTMFQVQSRTTTLSHQGIRAYYAAQSGLEWAKNKTLTNGTCAPVKDADPWPYDGAQGIYINASCTTETYTEGSDEIRWFRVNATAKYATPDSPDYVRRKVTVQLVNATN